MSSTQYENLWFLDHPSPVHDSVYSSDSDHSSDSLKIFSSLCCKVMQKWSQLTKFEKILYGTAITVSGVYLSVMVKAGELWLLGSSSTELESIYTDCSRACVGLCSLEIKAAQADRHRQGPSSFSRKEEDYDKMRQELSQRLNKVLSLIKNHNELKQQLDREIQECKDKIGSLSSAVTAEKGGVSVPRDGLEELEERYEEKQSSLFSKFVIALSKRENDRLVHFYSTLSKLEKEPFHQVSQQLEQIFNEEVEKILNDPFVSYEIDKELAKRNIVVDSVAKLLSGMKQYLEAYCQGCLMTLMLRLMCSSVCTQLFFAVGLLCRQQIVYGKLSENLRISVIFTSLPSITF